jgi:hypothetical protein
LFLRPMKEYIGLPQRGGVVYACRCHNVYAYTRVY